MTGSLTCSRCGTPIFSQWWDEAAGGFACRRCGTLNPGTPPARDSTRLVLGLSLAVVALWVIGVGLALAVLRLYPDGPWRLVAIASFGLLIAGFAVLIATIVLAVSRRA